MREGTHTGQGTPPRRRQTTVPAPTGSPRLSRERPIAVRSAPATATPGSEVVAEFDADHPNTVLRPTYLLVEKETPDGWATVADDSSFSTEIRWRREKFWYFVARVVWRVPADATGTYRVSYLGRTVATTDPVVVS